MHPFSPTSITQFPFPDISRFIPIRSSLDRIDKHTEVVVGLFVA